MGVPVNRDKASAGLILIAVAIYGAIWYYRRKNAFQGTTISTAMGRVAIGNPTPKISLAGTPLQKLVSFAALENLRVTSTTGGKHVKGSLHYQGRAVDISTRGLSDARVQEIINDAKGAGLGVIDERIQPAGEREWTNPHLHLQIPF
jgi:hypothetical protein